MRSGVLETLRHYWGYESLRPLQEEAIAAVLDRRDSLLVLPTGGGKSLCYQIPAVLDAKPHVVVSPLISLMKDQVDGLRACGYPALAFYGGMAPGEIREAEHEAVRGRAHLLFVAPERLLTERFLGLIATAGVAAFHVDEAHCISHWGHDFRPEYRRLVELKGRFPNAAFHAYTATATERVREDIVAQLGLREPRVLVGRFDRPNLVYRIQPRIDAAQQTLAIVRRHAGQAVIVYCISRKDTETLARRLSASGVRALHYHAGMPPEARAAAQDAFIRDEVDVVVATVAFGMGIDRSDVRAVVHAAMPKSIEHYQQETGRAGRDGLEAECVLLYSAADGIRWEQLVERAAGESTVDVSPEHRAASLDLLRQMRRYCARIACRHRQLTEYFGQTYDAAACGACDVCLGEVEGVSDGTLVAQKILSCVARVEQRFGVEHVADVLLGADTERVRRWNHERLSTYGLLRGTPRKELTHLIYQLLDDGLLERTASEHPVLRLNEASWEVLRGARTVRLQAATKTIGTAKGEATSWSGVDRSLFEVLRSLRREIAAERGVPPYVVFSDASLRDMARLQPRNPDEFLAVHGVGAKKLADLGDRFLSAIRLHAETTSDDG